MELENVVPRIASATSFVQMACVDKRVAIAPPDCSAVLESAAPRVVTARSVVQIMASVKLGIRALLVQAVRNVIMESAAHRVVTARILVQMAPVKTHAALARRVVL